MTQSLPAQAPWSPSRKDAFVNAAAGVTLRTLPRIPEFVKRLLLGGRSVTIDGNTLDTTLQLMLAGQRATGIDGLAVDDDVIASRARL
jgi:acetyl esterase